jgi:hypothetical protein
MDTLGNRVLVLQQCEKMGPAEFKIGRESIWDDERRGWPK